MMSSKLGLKATFLLAPSLLKVEVLSRCLCDSEKSDSPQTTVEDAEQQSTGGDSSSDLRKSLTSQTKGSKDNLNRSKGKLQAGRSRKSRKSNKGKVEKALKKLCYHMSGLHNAQDTKYYPEETAKVRKMLGIKSDAEFCGSFVETIENIENGNPSFKIEKFGASGSAHGSEMYVTTDKKWFIKGVKPNRDMKVQREQVMYDSAEKPRIEHYFKYILERGIETKEGRTYMPLYTLMFPIGEGKNPEKWVYLVSPLVPSILAGVASGDYIYDLKGNDASKHRRAKKGEIVRKEQDFQKDWKELHLPHAEQMLKDFKSDATFLTELGLIDYSLVLSLKKDNKDNGNVQTTDGSPIAHETCTHEKSDQQFSCHFAIIDVWADYGSWKKLGYTAVTVFNTLVPFKSLGTSSLPATEYKDRFMKSMEKIFSSKEGSEESKTSPFQLLMLWGIRLVFWSLMLWILWNGWCCCSCCC